MMFTMHHATNGRNPIEALLRCLQILADMARDFDLRRISLLGSVLLINAAQS